MKSKIRLFKDSDIDFVTATWLNWYKKNSQFGRSLSKNIYYKEHQKMIHNAINNSSLLVQCDPEMPDVIYSYLCGLNTDGCDIIHFVYSKRIMRGMDFVRKLVENFRKSKKCFYTHEYKKRKFDIKGYSEVVYNPYLFFTGVK